MNQVDELKRVLQMLNSSDLSSSNVPSSQSGESNISEQEILHETDNPLEIIDLNARRNSVKPTTWYW